MFIERKLISKVVVVSLALCLLPTMSTTQAHASLKKDITPTVVPCKPMSSPLEQFPASLALYSESNHELQCGRSIPTSLLISARVVNISKFTTKFEGGKLRDPRTHWYIERDYAGHGGSHWKLKSPHSNPTVYSIRKDWSIR